MPKIFYNLTERRNIMQKKKKSYYPNPFIICGNKKFYIINSRYQKYIV